LSAYISFDGVNGSF
jgi:septal ring factor EnvC (AmiA/AmiB activator)